MLIGITVVGSHLTTGICEDRHLSHVIKALDKRGLELAWGRILSGDPALITRQLRESMQHGDTVFVFGGTGCSPDDQTRESAAEAAGVRLVVHPEAAVPETGIPRLPEGCDIIPNARGCPGFSLRGHYFLPGAPEVAWPMLEWVLNRLGDETGIRVPLATYLIHAHDTREQELLDLMATFVDRFPEVGFSSLPHSVNEGSDVEFGVRGQEQRVRDCLAWLAAELNARGCRWEAKRHSMDA